MLLVKRLLLNTGALRKHLRSLSTAVQDDIIFRQLFDNETCTYTYLIGDVKTRNALIIDPVLEKVDRDLLMVQQLGLNLRFALNTHVHADHVTGTGQLKKKLDFKVKSVISKASRAQADIQIEEGDIIKIGDVTLEALSTPGHTSGCTSYVCNELRCVFTGDTLLIRGCGRTDFQEGSPELLYDSIHNKLLCLPKDYKVYPAHDYMGQTVSTIEEETKFNVRARNSRADFVKLMKNLKLAYPKKMDVAVPANLVCGLQDSTTTTVPK